MAEFKPMIKMETDEPSVILKLKKGGHVNMKHHKGDHEHKPMHHMAMGGMMPPMNPLARAMAARRRPAAAPMVPAQAAPGPQIGTPGMGAPAMKKGGKVHHKAKGGHMEKELHKVEKELKHHEEMKAGKAHHGLKHGGKVHHKYAKGGKVSGDHLGAELDRYDTRDTIENDAKNFLQTKVVGADKRDTAHGTGQIKEQNAGGYKHGGKVHHHAHGGKVHRMTGHAEGTHEHHKAMAKHYAEKCKEGGSAHMHKMHEHHKHMAKMCKGGAMGKYATGGTVSESKAKEFLNTKLVGGDKRDTVHGTGGIKEDNGGGYKRGGKVHHKYAKGGVVENLSLIHI